MLLWVYGLGTSQSILLHWCMADCTVYADRHCHTAPNSVLQPLYDGHTVTGTTNLSQIKLGGPGCLSEQVQ